MQFETFDKKVKDAADHHYPAYDEKAWTRMEKLLNKHLPNKEDNRRRIIFFLLLFLLVGGGTWLFISKPWQGDRKIEAITPVPATDPASDASVKANTTERILVPGSTENLIPDRDENTDPSPGTVIADQPFNETPAQNDLVKNNWLSNRKTDQTSFSVIGGNTRSSTKDKPDQPVTELPPVQNPVVLMNETPEEKTLPVTGTAKVVTSSPVAVSTEKPVQKKDPVVVKADVPEKQATETNKQKNKTDKKNSLFFSLGAGPDLSFVGSGNSSKVKLLAGAGIGFTYKEKFTLRTGFYTGRKVYSAKASDYYPPPGFTTLYPYLEKVDANCKVYEIPLALSYNFGKKSNWFVSAGLSTFLMKEETYDYTYKYTPTGSTYTRSWTIKDENSHYFSVGTLSAGYKQDIGKRITVMAEPYVKIPFAGVGYGKVKLNSGGVLFTVGIKAF
jgi:opacity protein-like surface antigen